MSYVSEFINKSVNGSYVIDVFTLEYDFQEWIYDDENYIRRNKHKYIVYLMAQPAGKTPFGKTLYQSKIAVLYDKECENVIVFKLASCTITSWSADLVARFAVSGIYGIEMIYEHICSVCNDDEFMAITAKLENIDPSNALIDWIPYTSMSLNIPEKFIHDICIVPDNFSPTGFTEFSKNIHEEGIADYTIVRKPSGNIYLYHLFE